MFPVKQDCYPDYNLLREFERERLRCHLESLAAVPTPRNYREKYYSGVEVLRLVETKSEVPPSLLKEYLKNRVGFQKASIALAQAKHRIAVMRNAIPCKLTQIDLAILYRKETEKRNRPMPPVGKELEQLREEQSAAAESVPVEKEEKKKWKGLSFPGTCKPGIEEQIELQNMAQKALDNPQLNPWNKTVFEMEEDEQIRYFYWLTEFYNRTKKLVGDLAIANHEKNNARIAKEAKEEKLQQKANEVAKGQANPVEFKKTLVKMSEGDKKLASMRKTLVDLATKENPLPPNFLELDKKALVELMRKYMGA